MNKWIKIPEKSSDSDFIKLFKKREFIQLSGSNGDKILKLSAIIFLTLLTLAYALGSLDQLRERMDNPYTNWVDMPLSTTGENSYDSLPVLMEYFTSKTEKDRYSLDNIIGYVASDAKFVNKEDFQKQFGHKGRTIEPEEKLLKAILEPKNVLRPLPEADSVFVNNACGIIITKAALEGLGFTDWKSVEKIAMKFYDDYIYIDVLGVVKDLPDYCDFICTPRFYNLLLNGSVRPHDTGVVNADTTNIMYVASTIGDTKRVQSLAEEHMTAKGFKLLNIKQEPVKLNATVTHYKYALIFNHSAIPDKAARKSFFDASKGEIVSSTDWFCVENSRWDVLAKPYWLAFNFTDLGEVREFKTFMANRFRMSINLAQVEAKDNFKKVSQITFVVCSTLFIFGILSIVLFITNLLRSHLEGIRSNLGTLKAFGLKDQWLQDTYNVIIFFFLFFSFVIALVPLSVLIGATHVFMDKSPFDLLNLLILLGIALIFGISLYFARTTTGDLIKATPGDLIYGR